MMFDTNSIRHCALRTARLTASVVASAQSPSVRGPVTTQIAAGAYHTCALTAAGGALGVGNHTITASYGGDGNNEEATSVALNQSVRAA